MGMYVSELRSVPVGAFTYYLYLVDVSGSHDHSNAITTALQDLAVKSGASALVVSGPTNLSMELYDFLRANAKSDFVSLEQLLHSVSSLVVCEGGIQTTKNQIFVIPLIARGATGASVTAFLAELVGGLLASMHSGQVPEYCQSLGAESLDLVDLKGGLLVTTLRNANKFLELKPGVAGVGVNLNAVIERFIGPSTRPLGND